MKRLNFLKLMIRFFFVLILILSFASCDSRYSKTVKQELRKGIKKDSLIFGMFFGDTRSDFYNRCWLLNRQKLVTHSSDNEFVSYTLVSKDTLNSAKNIEMLFYGNFDKNNIMRGMNMKFRFYGWAIWNKEYQAENLIFDVIDTLESWYSGNKFFKVSFEEKLPEDYYVKIDGNRQIKAYTSENTQDVIVVIDDISYTYKDKIKF